MDGAPPEKKQKTEEAAGEKKPEDVEMPAAEEKAPEPPKEMEEDAPPAKTDPRIKATAAFLVPDTTMNIMPSTTGNVMIPLTDGGIQHFFAGARANVGVKVGRYMFEVKVVELMTPTEDHGPQNRTPKPRQILRIGFTTAKASNIMAEADTGSAWFDSEGGFACGMPRTWVGEAFSRDVVVAVLLNLDESSPNANTISLFKNGVRASQPQALPEALKGQALYPTISWKCMALHVNLGKDPINPLPFTCRMIADASQKHATVTEYKAPAKEGQYEVVFPIGLPDEGVFEWLKLFHDKNPGYMELSDQMILSWAERSGIWRSRGYAMRSSNDKPELTFGIPELDDGSIHRVLRSVAPLQARNFVCIELKSGLIKQDRKDMLVKFSSSGFKKVANVLMGEPTADFKKRTNELVLKQKQATADIEFRAKKIEEKRKRDAEKRARDLELAKKKAERERRKAEREIKKKAEAIKKAAEEKLAAEKKAAEEKAAAEKKAKEDADTEKKDEPMEEDKDKQDEKKEPAEEKDAEMKDKEKEEEEKDSEEEEEEENEEPQAEEKDEKPPSVELTPEEKKIWFFKATIPDLTPNALGTILSNMSLPAKDEGFDEVKYEWQKEKKAQEYMKQWVLEKKMTTRIEDLNPSEWFKVKWTSWQKLLQQWHSKLNAYKAAVAKKEAEKSAKAAKKAAEEAAAKRAAAAAAAQKENEEKAADGEEKEKETETPEEKKQEEPEEEEESPKVDFANLDVFGVDDAQDLGGGEPLFKEFQFEDWTMMSLRFELHLLVHTFRRDVDDPERLGIHLDHLGYYYNRYFKKALSTKYYGVDTYKDLIELVNDAVYVTTKNLVDSQLDAEMECWDIFVKLTEEARRYRALRLALGEEAAKLKLSQPQFSTASQGQGYRGDRNKGWGSGGKGWNNYGNKGWGGKGYHQQQRHSQQHSPQHMGSAPRTVAPRTVRPPNRQDWQANNMSKGK